MVSLRDGKSYDVDITTPTRRRTTRRSTRRESNAPAEPEPAVSELHDKPETPTEVQNRGFKRGRASEQPGLEPITDLSPRGPDTVTLDQDALKAAAETELPTPRSASPLPKKKARTAAQPAPSSKVLTTGLGWILVVALAVSAAALWSQHRISAKPAWRQALRAADSLFTGLQLQHKLSAVTGSTAQLLQTHASGIQQHASVVLRQLHVKYPTLVPNGWAVNQSAVSKAWPSDVLSSILPPGDRWRELSVDITDKLRTPAAQRSYKATAVILGCASADDCNNAAEALSVLPPGGSTCSLLLDGPSLATAQQPAAALQASLAAFLKRCPNGLVLLQQAEQMPVAAVPAMHNALSELGGFQHNGAVDSSRAAYILLMQMPVQQVFSASASADTGKAGDSIKEAFFATQQRLLEQQRPQQQDSTASEAWSVIDRALKTLHRRIDFAAPVKLGAAAEAKLSELYPPHQRSFEETAADPSVTIASALSAGDVDDVVDVVQA